MGGVELPAVQGTVPVWDVPSFFLSLPTSFGSVLLPLRLLPLPFWNLLCSKTAKGPENWGGNRGIGGEVLGNKEHFQGSPTLSPIFFPSKRLQAEGTGLHFPIPQHI